MKSSHLVVPAEPADTSLVIYGTGGSLYVDASTVVEADLSEMPVPSKTEVKALFNGVVSGHRPGGNVTIMPAGKALRRQMLHLCAFGVDRADLSSKEEFWDLLELICGLGVKGQQLAAELETTPEVVSRYRARRAAPTNNAMRRLVLDEALKLAA